MSSGCRCNTKYVPYANSLKGRIKKEPEKLGNRKRWCYANEEQERSRLCRREAGNERRRARKTQENVKRQTGTTKWTEDERRSSGVPSEKVWRKKRRFQRLKQGQTDRKKESAKRGGVCVWASLSQQGAGGEIKEGKMEG